MKTETSAGKPAFSVRFDAPQGPSLILHPKSSNRPDMEGRSLLIDRITMARFVREWRALGAPELVRGISRASTAFLTLARLGKLKLPTR